MSSEEKRGKARKSLAFFLGSLFLPGAYGNSSRLLNFLRIEITKVPLWFHSAYFISGEFMMLKIFR